MFFFNFFTEQGGWLYASFLGAVVSAFMMLVNQYFKQSGNVMVFLFRVIVAVTMLPFIFYLEASTSMIFYGCVILIALSGGLADIRLLNITAKYGGGMASRLSPLAIFTTFPLWFLFDHGLFFKYLETPIKSIAIIATLCGCGYFASRFRKSDINKQAIIDFLPCLLGYTIAGIASKVAMTQGGNPMALSVFYFFTQSLILAPIIFAYMFVSDNYTISLSKFFNKQMLQASVCFALLWIFAMSFRLVALITVPNPAYLTVISLLSPVIISVIYYLLKHKEQGDVISGFGIVLCAAIMAFLTV